MVIILLDILLGCSTLFAVLYTAFAAVRVVRYARRPVRRGRCTGAVSVLKPLCGVDAELAENLRSFFRQAYPRFELLFGVRDPQDPAIPIVRQVMAEFPRIPARLIVNPHAAAPNHKVGNLASMAAVARYDIFVLSDSDMRVTPDYLRTVVAPLRAAGVGAATCLYRGRPLRGIPSALAAMGINEWFIPAVLVATTGGPPRYCFGATVAIRRSVLDALGGFAVLAEELADDYRLGERVSALGLRVCLSPYLVENVVEERSWSDLLRHELRWARTIRAAQPLGHALSFLMYPLPLAALAALVLPGAVAAAALSAALTARFLLHGALRTLLGTAQGAPCRAVGGAWLVPLRDLLGFAMWGASFFGRGVHWRARALIVKPTGQLARHGMRAAPRGVIGQ